MKTNTVQDQLVYSTIRIIATDGKEVSIGTGFFVTDIPASENIPYLATNKHVVGVYDNAQFMFCKKDTEGKPIDDEHVTITVHNLQQRIIPHPDENVDLCFIALGDAISTAASQGKAPYFLSLGTDFFITEAALETMTAIENVIMIGYPEGLIDEKNNKPVVRKGITATSLNLDYAGKKEFMIDMAVFHGSSGSPVIVETTGLSQWDHENGIQIGVTTHYCFAGVVYGVPKLTVEGKLKVVEAPTSKKVISEAELMTNLGFVIKAERIRELLKIAKGT